MELVMKVVGAVRNLRSEMDIPPAKKVEVILYCADPESLNALRENRTYVETLARTATLVFQSEGSKPRASATSIVEGAEVFLPLKGLINLDEEERRLQKELTKASEDLSRAQRKLQNQDFVGRARPEAVEKEREKAKALAEKEAKLQESLERVKGWRKETT